MKEKFMYYSFFDITRNFNSKLLFNLFLSNLSRGKKCHIFSILFSNQMITKEIELFFCSFRLLFFHFHLSSHAKSGVETVN